MTNVTMTGFVKHEHPALSSRGRCFADAVQPLHRSFSSGQDIAEVINPMKMFEYMAAGRGIVSADLPSIREVLNEGMRYWWSLGILESGKWKLNLCLQMSRVGWLWALRHVMMCRG
jgi:hypothetical protein